MGELDQVVLEWIMCRRVVNVATRASSFMALEGLVEMRFMLLVDGWIGNYLVKWFKGSLRLGLRNVE